jgi:hypothetical protein
MNEPPSIPSPDAPLQFETAHEGTAGPAQCASCETPLLAEYHQLNGHAVCAICRAKEEVLHGQDQQWSRFVTAGVYGAGAALVGALGYWAFVKLTNLEFGLVAIAVGWMVGKAVMKGSNLRGGRRYQFLALALTYLSITFSYGALMAEELIKASQTAPASAVQGGADKSGEVKADAKGPVGPGDAAPSGLGILLGFVLIFLIILASPFLAGFSNGLYEAWRQTRLVPFSASGPHPLGSGPLGAPAEVPSAE